MHGQPFGPVLRQAVAGRLERGVRDAFAREPAMLDRKVTISGVVRPVVT
jgi:hypothetical protein